MKLFAKRAYQLLESMFQFDDVHIVGAFLHPNYEALRYATSRQIEECHQRCRQALVNHTFDSVVDEPITEPHHKKRKFS